MVVGIYRTERGRSKRVGELSLSDEGFARLSVLDKGHEKFLSRLMKDGVKSYSKKKAFVPSDGKAFLEAVLETVHGSYWRSRDDTDALAQRRAAARPDAVHAYTGGPASSI